VNVEETTATGPLQEIQHSDGPICGKQNASKSASPICVDIYIAQHCFNCAYAYEIVDEIQEHFPHVRVRLIDLDTTTEPIPEAVFATPTYLLNGRVWSLGNPSPAQVHETLQSICAN